MNKKTAKAKSIIIKFSMGLYEQTWLITLTWFFIILSLALLWDHNQCVKCANAITWITSFGAFNLIIFFISVGILLIFTLFEIFDIRRGLKDRISPNILIANINLKNKDEKITILPIYMIWIYSFSRIFIFFFIMLFSKEKSVTNDLDIIWIWFFILFVAFPIWFYLRNYADKNYVFSIGYTVLVIAITWLTLEWKTLIPYMLDISTISQCITEKYILEHNLTTEHNISKCIQAYQVPRS